MNENEKQQNNQQQQQQTAGQEQKVSDAEIDSALGNGQEGQQQQQQQQQDADPFDIDEGDYDNFISDPKKFKSFIIGVHDHALAQARVEMEQREQNITRSIPEVVDKSYQRTRSIETMRNQFFNDNPALRNHMPYVRDMIGVISRDNPDWDAKKVLDEVGNRAKRDLAASIEANSREQERQPTFAGTGGRQAPGGTSDNRTAQQKMIDETFGFNK